MEKAVDTGHLHLVNDLKHLLDQAESFQFHDFKNEMYAAPKVVLVQILESMAREARSGKYDN